MGCNKRQVRGWIAVFGGFLIHLTLGTLYSFGNMTPYLTSYIRAYSNPNIQYTDSMWIFGTAMAFMGLTMFIGGLLYRKFGPRVPALVGGLTLSLGTALTGLAIQKSFGFTVFTYAMVVGLGTGLAYTAPLACAMQWLPNHKGLVNGIVAAGFGGGAFVFDQIQTAFINPQNLSPDDSPNGREKYYTSENAEELLANVPRCYYMLGACYAAVQIVGCIMISSPPPADDQETRRLLSHGSDNESQFHSEEVKDKTVVQQASMHPRDVLRTRAFYTLWFIFLVNAMAVLFVSSLYKAYGQTFIADDRFLALLGAFASVGNALGRIAWGKLVDRFSFKACMMSLCAVMVALMCTLIATPTGGKAMFFIWICLVFIDFSGNFALLPTATARAFGAEYVAINYGLIFSSQAVCGMVGSILSTTLNEILGWSGMFFLVAGFAAIGMALTASFNVKDARGKDI